jgi:hypothetical protein
MYLPQDKMSMERLARTFAALQNIYSAIRSPPLSDQFLGHDQYQFPYIRSFKLISDPTKTVQFDYVTQLCDDKLLFEVKSREGHQLLVKFTEAKYGLDAHRFLANKRFAPQVFGFEKVSGEWKMIVMEYMRDYTCLGELPAGIPIPGAVYDAIMNAVQILHNAGYVHGDLRRANILYRENRAGADIALVDFDWAAKVEEAVYPGFLNVSPWPSPLCKVQKKD